MYFWKFTYVFLVVRKSGEQRPLNNDFIFFWSPKPLEMFVKYRQNSKALCQTILLFSQKVHEQTEILAFLVVVHIQTDHRWVILVLRTEIQNQEFCSKIKKRTKILLVVPQGGSKPQFPLKLKNWWQPQNFLIIQVQSIIKKQRN